MSAHIFPLNAYAAAFLLGLVLADLLAGLIVEEMWLLMRREVALEWKYQAFSSLKSLRRYRWQGRAVGIVERALYMMSILVGRPEFIAVWLTLKTVARSTRWTKDEGVRGRAIYNAFLVGNGLSILFAIVAAALLLSLTQPTPPSEQEAAVLAALAVPVASLLGWGILIATRALKDRKIRRDLPSALVQDLKPYMQD